MLTVLMYCKELKTIGKTKAFEGISRYSYFKA
jgi:hypothetical protein